MTTTGVTPTPTVAAARGSAILNLFVSAEITTTSPGFTAAHCFTTLRAPRFISTMLDGLGT